MSLWKRVISLGDKDTLSILFGFSGQSDEEVTRRATLIRVSSLTSFFGLLWIATYALLGIPEATTAVVGYIALTLVNISIFYFTKHYHSFRLIQLVLILFMPFGTQLYLGGFIPGSGVMLASMLSPLGALMFHSLPVARRLFLGYVLLIFIAGFAEYRVPNLSSVTLTEEINLLFFVIDSAAISAVFFLALAYFLKQKEKYQALLNDSLSEISEKNEELYQQQEEITAQRDSLEEKNQELHAAVEQIQKQRDVIEAKNLNITASINYAQRIQSAMLPTQNIDARFVKEYFIFFKPKDIVSGDFYWYLEHQGKLIMAAVDCTGHGVPGAFMSLIGNNLLTRIVQVENITEPHRILERLHDGVTESLKQDATQNRDGMDVAMVCIDPEKQEMEFAGAGNPLVLIQDGTMQRIKGDRYGIGGSRNARNLKFQPHQISLDQPTTFFLFSDGYQDQFGGPEGRKYLSSRFREFLKEGAERPCTEQHRRLETNLNDWVGNGNQIDDILVMGCKVG
ncbi:MAG: SpoIIE family protein phosphatase [Bacteroidota bacterium]